MEAYNIEIVGNTGLIKYQPGQLGVERDRSISLPPGAEAALDFLHAIYNYRAGRGIFYRAQLQVNSMRVEIGEQGDPDYSVIPVLSVDREPVEVVDSLIDLLGRDYYRNPDFFGRLYLLSVFSRTDQQMAEQIWRKWVEKGQTSGVTNVPNFAEMLKGFS